MSSHDAWMKVQLEVEREVKEKSTRMTLYKGTLEDEGIGDDEPQIEPSK